MAHASDTSSLYEILEVSTSASREEIEASYQRIVGFLGPDSMVMYSMLDDSEAERLRAQVDEAYRTLADPTRRAAYDRARGYPEAQYSSSRPAGEASRPAAAASELAAAANEAARAVFSEPSARAESPEESEVEAAPVAPAAPPRQEPAVSRVDDRDAAPQVSRPATAPRRGASGGARRSLNASIVVTPDTEFSGALLKRLRESCNASLDDLAEMTKISKRYLHALEENDFSTLPAMVYVRGFVSEYARALGLDSRLVAKSYMALYERARGGNG